MYANTLTHNAFQISLEKLIEAQLDHIQKLITGYAANMSKVSALREICTLTIGTSKGIGCSTFLSNLKWASSSIVMVNESHLRTMDFEVQPLAKVTSLDYLQRLQFSRDVEPKTRVIFVDRPALISGIKQNQLTHDFYQVAARYTKLELVVAFVG